MASRSCQRVRPHSAAVSTADRPASKCQSISRKLREKRVKSALESRREQEASAIFPREVQIDPEWGITKYSEDYGPKKRITPVPVRPSSPTRMHNPHPAKPFLTWIHPTRIHQHSKASLPPQDAWKYIKERFYDDYTDTSNTGDAHNEVPITNLAKINFPGERKQNGLCSMPHLGGIAGTKVHLNIRAPKDVARDIKGSKSHLVKNPSPLESRAVQATVSTNALPIFKQWLGVASSQEREVIMRMLQAGYTDSEEARLKKAVHEVLQPESATKIEDWLKSASEAERQVALNVLEQLAIATVDMTESQYHPPNYYYASGFGHHRSHTYPVSLSRHQVPHRHAHQQKTKCRHCSSGDERRRRKHRIENGGLGLIGKRIATQSKTDCSPQLWQNRILKKHGGATVIHAGGIFDQPKKDRGQHFDIHPEWPTV